jgi:hypothetical protein
MGSLATGLLVLLALWWLRIDEASSLLSVRGSPEVQVLCVLLGPWFVVSPALELSFAGI